MEIALREGIQSMNWNWKGIDELAYALQKKSETDFKKVVDKNLLEMRNRAIKSNNPSAGGTPEDSRELKKSAGVSLGSGTMGYTKDYGPHVELGHRLVRRGKQVGYVKGQYFLKTNVNIQNKIYREDLERKMRE